MEFLGHFLGFSGACHDPVLAMPRPLCPELAQKPFYLISCVSCRGMVFACRGMPWFLLQETTQRLVFVSFGSVLARWWFYDFGTWILSLGLVLFGFRTLCRALRTPLRIEILLIQLWPWYFFWLGVRTARASELDFFVHTCSGLQVREYYTPYIVCEGLARMIVYVGLDPMMLLIKA